MTSASDNPKPYPADTLGMDAADMRRLGYAMVDAVVERLENKHTEPAIAVATPDELSALLGGPLPEQPLDAEQSIDLLINVALRNQQHGDHPRYFARVPGPSSYMGVLGEWLGVGFNTIAASWPGGAGPSAVELVVIDWLRQLMGLPEDTEGLLLSGGSHASLTAIAAVKAQRGRGRIYLTDQTHASILRAIRTLGVAEDDICVLPSDAAFTMDSAALEHTLGEDSAKGLKPLMVVATAGSTNTGACDPLNDIADICARENIWLHVDGAYGAPAALTESGRRTLSGMERADSLTIDPHKWFFQPYDAGCLLIRPGVLEPCFSMNPEYLNDVRSAGEAVDFRNRGLELTRRSRALKLWLSLRSYGVARFRDAIASSIELAEFAEQLLREDAQRWEVVTPAQLGILCFALRDVSDVEHQRRTRLLSESGYACATTTTLAGRCVMRLCIINPLTTQDDIRQTIRRLGSPDPASP